MKTWDTLFWQCEDLAALQAHLLSADASWVRAQLLQQFAALKAYRNAEEWNRLVRVCEGLRMVGWGEAEPVEAIAQQWINGAWYTRLQNSAFACVDGGQEQEWRVQQGVQVLAQQPDSMGGLAKLHSQRNPLPKSPIRWQYSGNYDRELQALIDSFERLKQLLIAHSRPETYGHDFAYVAWHWHFSHLNDEYIPSEYYHHEADVPEAQRSSQHPAYWIRPEYKVGCMALAKYETRLSITRHFNTAFSHAGLAAQQAQIAADLCFGAAQVRKKLQAKKSAYDCDAWEHDLHQILNMWQQSQ